MDLQMPDMDGAAATRRIRRQQNGVEVSILTTYDTPIRISPGRSRPGATGYMLKDASREDLMQAIQVAAVAAYLALDVTTLTADDPGILRAAYVGMELIVRSVIVPLAIATLISGIVMSLGTRWGLFRHYWVVISLLLTVFATVVLLSESRTISALAGIATDPSTTPDELAALNSTLVHSIGGMFVFAAILVLNVYKPQGMTRYGWRKQRASSPVLPYTRPDSWPEAHCQAEVRRVAMPDDHSLRLRHHLPHTVAGTKKREGVAYRRDATSGGWTGLSTRSGRHRSSTEVPVKPLLGLSPGALLKRPGSRWDCDGASK